MDSTKIAEPSCPRELRLVEEWFGGVIERPIDEQSRIIPVSPSGHPISEESKLHIAPSPTLKPVERIEIYNQQYWWRLLRALQENYPMVTRLFGYRDFNELLAKPALTKYPPSHWSLNRFGKQLVCWIEEEYHESDRALVLDAARVDWATLQAFSDASLPSLGSQLSSKDLPGLADSPLRLQPFLYLFDLSANLFTLRDRLMQEEVEYWEEHPFPKLKKERGTYILYRDHHNEVVWRTISPCQHFLLTRLEAGDSLAQACQALAEEDETLIEDALEHLHLWTREWALNGWLSLG